MKLFENPKLKSVGCTQTKLKKLILPLIKQLSSKT